MGIFGGFFRKVGSALASGAKAVTSGVKKVGTAVVNGVKKVAARVSGKDQYEEWTLHYIHNHNDWLLHG